LSLYCFESFSPKIPETCFIAPDATVIGDVILGNKSSIWFKCLVRGDVAPIRIGENSNVQDLSVLHITTGIPLIIGNGVSIGHGVTLHSCTIGDRCLIGMGSIILDKAVIGEKSLVAAGTLIPPGKSYPPCSLIKGPKGEEVRPLTDQEIEKYSNHYKIYLSLATRYLSKTFCEIL